MVLDHTKYVGKSADHSVSFVCLSSAVFHFIRMQENVKFSDDGEMVLEGKDTE